MTPLYTASLGLAILLMFTVYAWLIEKTTMSVAQIRSAKQPFWLSAASSFADTHHEPVGIQRYYNTAINEEEDRLMQEIDQINSEAELSEWFALLKTVYHHKNIPKKVYLRVSTILNGYVWFDEEEYKQRIQMGRPVHKVTPREYALEQALTAVTKKRN